LIKFWDLELGYLLEFGNWFLEIIKKIMQKRSTNLVIISGPSGSGKDVVIEGLAKNNIPIERVITTVTRSKRKGESEGKPYHFTSQEHFKELIEKNKLAEWAEVDNAQYAGVTKEELDRVKAQKNKIGIWKIEYKGVRSVKQIMPDVLAIFIEPPDINILAEHSRKRGKQTQAEIQDRLAYSKEFLEHKDLYDYSVVNEENKLDQTIKKVIDILKKEGFIH